MALGPNYQPPPRGKGDRVMRKLSTFALLLLASSAVAANAQCDQSWPEHLPVWDHQYSCVYPQGPWTNEATANGWSTFTAPSFVRPDLIHAIEVYRATIPQGQDNRRVTFAKFVNLPAVGDPYCENGPNRTTFEFTIKDGVQCKNTVVRDYGDRITFGLCSNGKTRICYF
jgi:hypothetical protein